MKLDQTDLKILENLQQDSKITHKEISIKLGLSVTAIYERVKKMEREKIISGYVALVAPGKVDRGFMVLCQIRLSRHTKEFLSRFENQVGKLPEVLECYHVSGEYDYILKVLVKDMEAYREFMVAKLTRLEHIGNTQSTFVITKIKNTTAIQLTS